MPAKAVRAHFAALFGTEYVTPYSSEVIQFLRLGTAPKVDFLAKELANANTPTKNSIATQFGASPQTSTRRLIELGLVRP